MLITKTASVGVTIAAHAVLPTKAGEGRPSFDAGQASISVIEAPTEPTIQAIDNPSLSTPSEPNMATRPRNARTDLIKVPEPVGLLGFAVVLQPRPRSGRSMIYTGGAIDSGRAGRISGGDEGA